MNLLTALSALAVTACVNLSAEMLAPQKHEPVPVDSVRVFVTEGELEDQDLEWESVAVLFARGSAEWTSEQGMLRKLREEAGKRGANGIILGEMKEIERRLAGLRSRRRACQADGRALRDSHRAGRAPRSGRESPRQGRLRAALRPPHRRAALPPRRRHTPLAISAAAGHD